LEVQNNIRKNEWNIFFGISRYTQKKVAITLRRTYPGLDSRENQHSQQEAHEENKLTSNGCKYAWKKVKTHQNDEVRYVFTPTK
jgi:hypothetical protein